MFDDLFQKDDEDYEVACHNCYYGSSIMSGRPDKFKCQLFNKHKDPFDICHHWRNSKHRLNLKKKGISYD